MQAAEGLDYAHLRGLIHSDVKPGNILVTPEGMAKVSDLGLAGFIHDAEQEDRPAGKIMGTADYLSPEQITSPLDVGPTSDIYSLGCTLYYAITGKVPFPGGTAQDKARRHCEETPWHPRRFNDEVVEEFVEIIADMMEKDPRLRIQTAAEVAARLEPWASDPSPISSQQMKKSPWLPPPLPWGGPEEDQQETSAESDGELDSAPGEQESVGHMSESTDPAESSAEETLPVRSVRKRLGAPPLMLGRRPAIPRAPGVVIALAISIPLCILAGGVLGFVLRALLE
jgi:serine/threonine protein kinase